MEEDKIANLRKREESLENIRQDIKDKEVKVLKKEEKSIKGRENSLIREEKYLQERERKVIEKERKIEFSNEAELLEERRDKLFSFLKNDKFLSAFVITSVASLMFSGLVKIGITPLIGVFSARIWFMLFIFSAIAAALVYFKKDKFAFLPIAAWVTWVAVEIRTLNLPGLRDITTGGWTLGPDLDPYLFLRWAKYIVAHGSIMVHDTMRYVPIGFDTSTELNLLSYMISWFHKIAISFGSTSVEQSAALFPAFMFALTVIAFFFLVRKMFVSSLGEKKASTIAVIASFFLSVIPAFIPRTIAGIPEKESAAFVFLFMSFLFFLYAWDSNKSWKKILFAFLAGASTLAISLIWGGSLFAFTPIALAVFIAFLLGQADFNRTYIYWIWMLTFVIGGPLLSNRGSIISSLSAPTSLVVLGVAVILLINVIVTSSRFGRYFERGFLNKLPKPLVSIIITLVLGIILVSLVFGPKSVITIIGDVKGHLVTPITDRIGITVAENRQPYFDEWASSFGPAVSGIPLTFWLFFIGSVYLFWKMTHVFRKKERIVMTLSYLTFLICIIFSRYSQSGLMNGTNMASLLVYAAGFIVLAGSFGYYYYQYYKSGESEKMKEIEFGLIMIFAFFFFCVIAARGAVRLTMMLVPPASIIVGYFAVSSFSDALKMKENTMKVIGWILVALVILSTIFAGYQFYLGANSMAASYAPSAYNQQWQKAMSWVRDNTPQNAVFGHWWDYGYWLQSIGERATVLDGGNNYGYWNHLMGRHGLTGRNDTDALEFLYAHNTTHFLIDSSDIGKYPAFSSIGSDLNYDRYSWLTTFVLDSRQTQETKNSTLVVYSGGFPLDGDIIYDNAGTKVFLPEGKAGLGAIVVERDNLGKITKNPIGIFVYQGKQYSIPLRYAYDDKLIDFDSGLDAGIFMFPMVSQDSSGQSISINQKGALIYLSDKTVMSQLARLYLYKDDNKFFKLVHSEDDFVVAQLKSQNATNADIVYYNGVRGPIRIWEIKYPKNITVNPAYLNTSYSDIKLLEARK